ncbi:MAG: hypothetical protein R2715_08575 [Ilumatobacteraceae bacterium]
MITGQTRLAALIGKPVRHSLSPALINTAFAEAGLDAVYTVFEVEPGDVERALDAVRALGMLGVTVTMPHKQAVFAAVDELDPAAAALGAVNCVVRRPDSTLLGCNTDGGGLVDSLRLDAGWEPAGQEVVVLGAGGRPAPSSMRWRERAPGSPS